MQDPFISPSKRTCVWLQKFPLLDYTRVTKDREVFYNRMLSAFKAITLCWIYGDLVGRRVLILTDDQRHRHFFRAETSMCSDIFRLASGKDEERCRMETDSNVCA